MGKVTLITSHPKYRIKKDTYRKRSLALLKGEHQSSQSLNIILSTATHLRRLNRKYRKKDKTTDVLSFSLPAPGFIGEIYISLDRVRAQARRFGHSFDRELWRLMVHGIFHLLGYVHHTRRERLRMEKKEACYTPL